MTRIDSQSWKDKILDYEIETVITLMIEMRFLTWKDKILDYEIETSQQYIPSRSPVSLEKIRFSITRLKHWRCENNDISKFTWKDKILDYEIETYINFSIRLCFIRLEKIRFSITRLKLIPRFLWS